MRPKCQTVIHTHTHTRLTALFPGQPGWAGTRKVKPIWILLKQETVSGSGISWAIYKSAPCSRQITTPATHHSVFYRPDALPAAQPTVSKHWRDVSNSDIKPNHFDFRLSECKQNECVVNDVTSRRSSGRYTQSETTSQNLRSRYVRHFVGATWLNAWS